MENGQHESEYVTAAEASRILGVDEKTVVRAIRVGTISAIRLGRMYRIPREALVADTGVPVPTAPQSQEKALAQAERSLLVALALVRKAMGK